MQAYNKTDQQLHFLCQTIAKANRTYVTSQPDDSHTNLFYDDLDNRIVGRWINNGREQMMLTLNLATLHFEWLNSAKEVVQSYATIGKLASNIEDVVAEGLPAIFLNPQGYTDELHFQIPDYPFAGDPIQAISENDIHEWKTYRKLANVLCSLVLGYLELEGEIRIWPHHFDTGIYVEVGEKLGIGFGLAMEDSMAGAPYFYLSGYPIHGTLDYTDLPEFSNGRWEVNENWKGAILPLDELSSGIFEENRQVISDYLLKSINWCIRHN
jgi:hypothetical protein